MRIGICGHFGGKEQFFDGQTVKTKNVTKALVQKYGKDSIVCVDTYKIKKRFLSVFFGTLSAFLRCDSLIMLPAHNGIKVFTPLFSFLKKLFKKKIFYIVIGGWLASYLSDKEDLSNDLKKFDGIFVETNTMKQNLESMGFNNIHILPNFKDLKILSPDELVYDHKEPYKLCIFSRIMKEKGIDHAVDAVNEINGKLGRKVYCLDIYGAIDETQLEWFDALQKRFGDCVNYCGVVDSDKSVDVLKDYYALLFPTLFYTEGIPGTIIDAYAAGVPVVSARWESFDDIVVEGKTGFGYEFGNYGELVDLLLKIQTENILFEQMKTSCIDMCDAYTSKKAISCLSVFL